MFDTIIGENNRDAILTAVERKTSFMMMEKLKHSKNAKELSKIAVRMLTAYIRHVHTTTGDNGTEFAEHEYIAEMLKTKFFYTSVCFVGERSNRKYKQTYQTIYLQTHRF